MMNVMRVSGARSRSGQDLANKRIVAVSRRVRGATRAAWRDGRSDAIGAYQLVRAPYVYDPVRYSTALAAFAAGFAALATRAVALGRRSLMRAALPVRPRK